VEADRAAPVGGEPYYRDTRHTFPELLSALAAGRAAAGRGLDVGCGYGYLGEQLLKLGYSEIWGVEPAETAASAAEGRLTRVLRAPFPCDEVASGAPFDLIVFADTLEHLVDPWAALARSRDLMSDSGQLLVSVPNVSHFSVVTKQLKGRWTYTDQGLLDRTHLRFFTPATIRRAVELAGFTCVAERSSLRGPRWPYSWAIRALGERAAHLCVFQHVVLARPSP
jgi:2-polyprenyl-3-methyl-5-hydroxy-6-metoxy-1,4-benzoquinol methylase